MRAGSSKDRFPSLRTCVCMLDSCMLTTEGEVGIWDVKARAGRTSDRDGLSWPAMSSPVDAGVTELEK